MLSCLEKFFQELLLIPGLSHSFQDTLEGIRIITVTVLNERIVNHEIGERRGKAQLSLVRARRTLIHRLDQRILRPFEVFPVALASPRLHHTPKTLHVFRLLLRQALEFRKILFQHGLLVDLFIVLRELVKISRAGGEAGLPRCVATAIANIFDVAVLDLWRGVLKNAQNLIDFELKRDEKKNSWNHGKSIAAMTFGRPQKKSPRFREGLFYNSILTNRNYLRCLPMRAASSNIETSPLPKTFLSFSSARMFLLFLGF